jgi:hypothetical protein
VLVGEPALFPLCMRACSPCGSAPKCCLCAVFVRVNVWICPQELARQCLAVVRAAAQLVLLAAPRTMGGPGAEASSVDGGMHTVAALQVSPVCTKLLQRKGCKD